MGINNFYLVLFTNNYIYKTIFKFMKIFQKNNIIIHDKLLYLKFF